jgi:Mn-dependent DtxR family transcriptional regulator
MAWVYAQTCVFAPPNVAESQSGCKVTHSGFLEAQAHRHEIIEQYLVHTIGFTREDAHAEAERLEHVMSYELVNKIERTLISKK